MKKPALVILAAGIGRRYGSLKQMDAITTQGDVIIDFSIYDALLAGFGKFVFIIRKSFENEFRALVDHKIKGRAEVIYVFQELDKVPKAYRNPERVKPWGTGHALLLAKDAINENFAVINADDFYGREAFVTMAKSLAAKQTNSYHFCMLAYLLKNTVSEYGHVSRGECRVDANNYLLDITEHTHIVKLDTKLMRKNASGNLIPIDGNTLVSMNFWGFTPKCFEFGAQRFDSFLADNTENVEAEFFISYFINEILESDNSSIEVIPSKTRWFGVTYPDDKQIVKAAISKLKQEGVYPTQLWQNGIR